MAEDFNRYLIHDLEALVEKHSHDAKTLKKIDAVLAGRRVRQRNTNLRNKISELNKADASQPKESKTPPILPVSNMVADKPKKQGNMQLKTDSEITYPEGFLVGAFEEMRKKLLDISGGRSRLINLDQSRKGVVRVVDELPDELAKILLSEKAMTAVAIPEPTSEQLIEHGYIEWSEEEERYISLKKDPTPREWAEILGLQCDYDLPTSSEHTDDGRHTDLDLQSLLFEPALNASLKKLATEAKTSIDETGNNILFLSLGFLEWYDQVDGGKKRLAPLYMIPVSIEKKTVKGVSIYKLKYTGEDIIPNLTLREKLELDFGLTLPDITQVDEHERLLLPEEYFSEVSALLARKSNDPNVKQWKVRRFGTLATLSLGKLLMYLDLDPRK